jgi:hypothetical protein
MAGWWRKPYLIMMLHGWWRADAWLTARGKPLALSKHAAHAMNNERPEIDLEDVVLTLEEPDTDSREHGARRRVGCRTLVARYEENEDRIYVRTVSATRSR